MQTPETFRSLASMLLGATEAEVEEPDASTLLGRPEPVLSNVEAIPQDDTCESEDDVSEDEIELARDIRLFYARIVEAVEDAVERITGDIAADVLARELLLQPAELEAIVDRALQRFAGEEPLRVRVHAGDVPRVTCAIPVVADERLRPGDAVIELRGGSIDVSLGVRLSTALAAALA